MALNVLQVVDDDQDDGNTGVTEEEALSRAEPQLVARIRKTWEHMRNHRASSGLEPRLRRGLRTMQGEYSPEVLQEIRKLGGSEVFSRLVQTKARGATALLRDIYFASGRPWGLKPTDDPTLPEDMAEMIPELVQSEAAEAMGMGVEVNPEMIVERIRELMEMARVARKEQAHKEAQVSEDRINDILQQGGFYAALSEVLTEIPYFPFVCLKGPIVKMVDQVVYDGGVPQMQTVPRMHWQRVSPFDIFWTPGVSDITRAEICERVHWTRRDLIDMIDLPGWDEDRIRLVLDEYENGIHDWDTPTDQEQADFEGRESPSFNRSGVIRGLEYHGWATGEELLELGFSVEQITDLQLDQYITCWVVGNHVLKVQLNPSSRKRHPYYITAFDKVPGSFTGFCLVDMLGDIQDVANAAMRALVNNMGMASGPQVVVNADRLSDGEDPHAIYPWKRWMVTSDEFQSSSRAEPPVDFFQPQSNAHELLQIYQQMTVQADEISAIPRYITGSGATGGAGRTASGLNMLMQNAAKVLQQVAHNIDMDILYHSLSELYDAVMVADAGVELRGDENIVVKGVTRVVAKEAERVRQLEFLSLTSNPIDMQIIGYPGRAELLRAVASDLNLPSGDIVPSREQIMQMMENAPPPGAEEEDPSAPTDQPVTNTVQSNFNRGG